MINYFKSKMKIQNFLFLLVCLVLAFYGLRFGIIGNVIIMIVAGAYVLGRAIYLKELQFDMTMLFLFETFVIKAMLDQHTGKAWKVPTTLAMPVLMYLLGKLLVSVRPKPQAKVVEKITPDGPVTETIEPENPNKYDGWFTSGERVVLSCMAMAAGMTYFGLKCFQWTKSIGILGSGNFMQAYSDGATTSSYAFYFDFIMFISLAVALVLWALNCFLVKNDKLAKYKKWAFIAIFAIAGIIFLRWYVHDIKYLAFKEAVYLMFTQHWGNFLFTVIEPGTCGNMWLDYGRESGILVFGPLLIFFILTIKDAILLAANKQANMFVKALLITAFLLFNVFYFIDATAFEYQYYWFFGLMINGMISVEKRGGYGTIKDQKN